MPHSVYKAGRRCWNRIDVGSTYYSSITTELSQDRWYTPPFYVPFLVTSAYKFIAFHTFAILVLQWSSPPGKAFTPITAIWSIVVITVGVTLFSTDKETLGGKYCRPRWYSLMTLIKPNRVCSSYWL